MTGLLTGLMTPFNTKRNVKFSARDSGDSVTDSSVGRGSEVGSLLELSDPLDPELEEHWKSTSWMEHLQGGLQGPCGSFRTASTFPMKASITFGRFCSVHELLRVTVILWLAMASLGRRLPG